MKHSLAKFASAATTAIFVLVLAASPANAVPAIVVSSPTVAPGETVTFTATDTGNAALVIGCLYSDEQFFDGNYYYNDSETAFQYDYYFAADSGSPLAETSTFSVVFIPPNTICPSTFSATAASRLSFATVTIVRPSVPAGGAATLPPTGYNPAVLLSASGLLLIAGLGAVAIRHRRARG